MDDLDHLRRSLMNCFTAQPHDRKAERRADHEWVAALTAESNTRVIPLWRGRCVVTTDGGEVALKPVSLADVAELNTRSTPILLGVVNEEAWFAVGLDAERDDVEATLATHGEMMDLRTAGRVMNDDQASMMSHAKALCEWQERHRFCPACGSAVKVTDGGHVLRCTSEGCGRSHFPRMDPAIIVRVVRGDRILLGRQAVWAAHQYSVVAGFVEPGESLEQAVVREVHEETGIVVGKVHYQSSQPWPFPGNIMLGFSADAETDEITLNDNELETARWFTRDEIVDGLNERTLRVPPAISISFRLIEHWFNAGSDTPLLEVTERAGYEWAPPPQSS